MVPSARNGRSAIVAIVTVIALSGCGGADAAPDAAPDAIQCSGAVALRVDGMLEGALDWSLTGDHEATCGAEPALPDALFAIDHAAGWLEVDVDTARWHPVVELRAGCDTTSVVGCNAQASSTSIGYNLRTSARACVEAGRTYALVDGNTAPIPEDGIEQAGFFIQATLEPCAADEVCEDEVGCVSARQGL